MCVSRRPSRRRLQKRAMYSQTRFLLSYASFGRPCKEARKPAELDDIATSLISANRGDK